LRVKAPSAARHSSESHAVASLRDDPALSPFSRVWPFETGFTADAVPDRGPFIVHAEIWPGVLEPESDSHPIADARQVLALVHWAKTLDAEDGLSAEFSTPSELDDERVMECITEEAWTLGATNLEPRAATGRGARTRRSGRTPPEADAGTVDPRHHINALYRAGVIGRDERDKLMRRLS
jgi:hypothetical protein